MAEPQPDGQLEEEYRRSRSAWSEIPYVATGRTAPRARHESRIGTDEAHERLQAARNRAVRRADHIDPDSAVQ